jgi:hypothetical protein
VYTECTTLAKEDNQRCWITEMTLLTPDRLIINNYYNHAVKMVDTYCQTVTDRLQLYEQPYGAIPVMSTEIAVTLR